MYILLDEISFSYLVEFIYMVVKRVCLFKLYKIFNTQINFIFQFIL